MDLKQLYCKTIKNTLSDEIASSASIAEKLGKAKPNFVFEEKAGLFLKKSYEFSVKSCFTHLIRNSIDHGIEQPEVRAKELKSESGTIFIKSELVDNKILLSLRDDGQGIDLTAIKVRAIKSGLRSEADLNSMSEHDIAMLIFEPGFSTAKKVTDISGRGIGLDAVRKLVSDLGGNLALYLAVKSDDANRRLASFSMQLPTELFEYFEPMAKRSEDLKVEEAA